MIVTYLIRTSMRRIPETLREQIASDPFMKTCIRKHENTCSGRITWEHCFTYAGKQINEAWAIVPLCVYHHLGNGFDKEYGQYIALTRASEDELSKYPRVNWQQLKQYLVNRYEYKGEGSKE